MYRCLFEHEHEHEHEWSATNLILMLIPFYFDWTNTQGSSSSNRTISIECLLCSDVYGFATWSQRGGNYFGRCAWRSIATTRPILLHRHYWIARRQCGNITSDCMSAAIITRCKCMLQFPRQTASSVKLLGICLFCWTTKLSHSVPTFNFIHITTFYASL